MSATGQPTDSAGKQIFPVKTAAPEWRARILLLVRALGKEAEMFKKVSCRIVATLMGCSLAVGVPAATLDGCASQLTSLLPEIESFISQLQESGIFDRFGGGNHQWNWDHDWDYDWNWGDQEVEE